MADNPVGKTDTTAQHTPGPWLAKAERTEDDPYPGFPFAVRDYLNDQTVAYVTDNFTDPAWAPGNACLIAAAPDLLAACKAALAELFGVHMVNETLAKRDLPEGNTLPMLRAAIARAEGKSR
jgi:hypothetical protein